MSKYIIDTGDYLFTTDGVLVVGFDCDNKPATFYNSLDNLEELNSDYINENFGELQDEAYKRGYEDGKNSIDMGCEGCKYSLRFAEDEPCKSCSNCYKSKYEPMPKEDDRIEVGDEVRFLPNDRKGIVTACHVPDVYAENDKYAVFCGTTVEYVLRPHITKTGKHYDIASILEAMRTHD